MKGGKNVKRASTLRNLKEENGQQQQKKKHITHDRNLHSHAASPELYNCLSNIALSQTI